jgi:hypothetical protein
MDQAIFGDYNGVVYEVSAFGPVIVVETKTAPLTKP